MMYNRTSGLNSYEEFDSSADALVVRSKKERELGSEYEVVVLSGFSIDDVKKTHGRFFRLDDETGGRLNISQLA